MISGMKGSADPLKGAWIADPYNASGDNPFDRDVESVTEDGAG